MDSSATPARAHAPKAALFDAYGTLFDVYSVGLLAEQLFPGHGDRLAALWRDKQIEYTRLVSMSGRYRPFWDLTRAGLRFAAERLALALDQASEERLMSQYRHLSAFPENREVLAELQRRGIPTGILSNGDPEMLAVAVRSAGFADLLQHVLSVHEVQRYKTDPAAYALGPRAFGLPARDILFCSSPATAGTPSAPPGSATRRCGSTAAACRSRRWTPTPPTSAPRCATCWTASLPLPDRNPPAARRIRPPP
jgi:2-haloacid dehalogenase